ncbi:MAG: hypothetical protein GX052_00010 [Syntrophomonadaceae bacterium]|jgi:hypothetical protein|nr:hypothetical protein [Syntrophomonadaceae bacterium]
MMLRKLLKLILFASLIVTIVLVPGQAYALGDYHWLWVNKQIPVIDHNNIRIEIGCEVYCFWDRVIDIDPNTAYVFIVNSQEFEKAGEVLHVYKINDHEIKITGVVSLRTTKEFSERDALNKGLVSTGFSRFGQSGNDGKTSYYYKKVEINQSIFI